MLVLCTRLKSKFIIAGPLERFKKKYPSKVEMRFVNYSYRLFSKQFDLLGLLGKKIASMMSPKSYPI